MNAGMKLAMGAVDRVQQGRLIIVRCRTKQLTTRGGHRGRQDHALARCASLNIFATTTALKPAPGRWLAGLVLKFSYLNS
jgi:hypothetical protein